MSGVLSAEGNRVEGNEWAFLLGAMQSPTRKYGRLSDFISEYPSDLAYHGQNAAKGLAAGVMGAPVDLATMFMRPLGYSVPDEDVYASSEYIGKALGADTDRASFLAGLIGAPDSADVGKLASIAGNHAPEVLGAMTAFGKAGKKVKRIENELRPQDVSTGEPVSFIFVHNKEKSPDMGSRFGQDVEPKGKYMTSISEEIASTHKLPNHEYGEVTFENPLVIEFGGGYEDASNWKRVLSEKYGGLKGKELTEALKEDGYDGIITISETHRSQQPYVSEIVSLKDKR